MTRVHFIGIGGAGLSAIATVLLQQGYTVSGSDREASAMTERLTQLGATVFIGHRPENLAGVVDTVVISSAIAADNPELLTARQRGLTVSKRAEWLGQMMRGRVGIAIAGTHGKTTTTAMIAWILQQAGHDPTYIIGGFVPQLEANAAAGKGAAFVIEADEYDYTFLGLRPEAAVITMVEWDHPDIFPTPQAFQQAFADFVRLVPPDGLVIGCGDDPGVRAVIRPAVAPVVTYGLQPGYDWQAVEIQPNSRGGHDFIAARLFASSPLPLRGTKHSRFRVSLAVPGLHNVSNALAAMVIAHHQKVNLEQAAEILSEFKGVGRRFELKGEVNQIIVIDDYAHHPTEVRATLAAARARFGRRPIWAMFQPHTFSRTQALLDAFAAAFAEADHVIVTDIFAAREQDAGLVSSADIVARMRHTDVRYIGPLNEAADYLAAHLSPSDVLLTLGAGDGYKVGEWVLTKLRKT
jgi:UDP-N-acetylmuramate--alanine ligase